MKAQSDQRADFVSKILISAPIADGVSRGHYPPGRKRCRAGCTGAKNAIRLDVRARETEMNKGRLTDDEIDFTPQGGGKRRTASTDRAPVARADD
jgi:hypothetical protein